MRSKACVSAFFLLAALGCGGSLSRVEVSINGTVLRVEVARTDAERERGLMFRKSLGEREGMLFVFEKDERLAFWMKDTPLPLSIAFLSSEGKILEIEDMQPYSREQIRSRFSARYALEVPRGAFLRMGAKEGDIVVLPPGFK
jgi:uncharacterized membrane protein (UPF0127 family)